MNDWLIDYVQFYVPLKNFSLIWIRHHCRWRAANFRPMLGAQGLWAGRDFYRATTTVTRDLGFSGLIRRTTQFSRLLRHTRGFGGYSLAHILTGYHMNEEESIAQLVYGKLCYLRIISKWSSHDYKDVYGIGPPSKQYQIAKLTMH
jgi:hypothetical protein